MPQLGPAQVLRAWDLPFLGLFAVVAASYLMATGPRREWFGLAAPYPALRRAAFVAGLAVLYLAFGSPLAYVGMHELFSAHMLQHVLVIWVGVPLLLYGTPPELARYLTRRRLAVAIGRVLARPIVALVVFLAAFSFVHAPPVMDAMRSGAIAYGEELFLLVAAVVLWLPILSPWPEIPRPPYVVQLLYLFGNIVALMPVDGLIIFGKSVYTMYGRGPQLWGLSPLSDQQWGGIIMNVAMDVFFTLPAVVIFYRWAEQERRQPTLAPGVRGLLARPSLGPKRATGRRQSTP